MSYQGCASPFLFTIIFVSALFVQQGCADSTPLPNNLEKNSEEPVRFLPKRLVGVWDLSKIDSKSATDIFTTEFRQNGTYSTSTSACEGEQGTWHVTGNSINVTVTHSPNCVTNVGRKFSDQFVIYGEILIVYIFDKKSVKHIYKFKKRTLFFEA